MVAPGLLEQQLDRVLETGLAYEREESTRGLLCVAAPVLDVGTGAVLAALSVTGPVGRFRPEAHESAVRATAAAIAGLLTRRPGAVSAPPS
ncbi:Bacterial transcriptional regulator [compost metagenome]